jgi:HK97 family phage major capsid protein
LDGFKSSVIGRIDAVKQENDERFAAVEQDLIKMARPNLGSGDTRQDAGHTKAFINFLRTGRESAELSAKAMQAGVSPDGGYLVPPELDRLLTKYLRNRSPMRQLARVIPISAGEFKMPHATTTAATSWVGETSARPVTSSPSFKMVTIPTCEVYASPAVTQQLLDDNVFDLENWLVEELGDAFADAEADAFINGNGITRPRGLFTYDVVATADATRDHDKFQYVVSGGNGTFGTNYDGLLKLVYAVAPQYRSGSAFLTSPEVIEELRKLKNATTNDYIWQPATQAGQPATLFGYPIFEDANVPALASGSISLAFGDFKRGYTITDRSTSLMRDAYTSKPYVHFYSTKRLGGGAGRDTRAVKFLKFSAS